jgi:hypothetical protein
MLLLGRDVVRWRGRALSKEILLHLPDDYFLIFTPRRVQAVLVQQHLAKLRPLLPSLLRHIVVDFLAKLGIEGGLFQPGQFLVQLYAHHFPFSHFSSLKNYLTAEVDGGPKQRDLRTKNEGQPKPALRVTKLRC